jgi:hypothetical protein
MGNDETSWSRRLFFRDFAEAAILGYLAVSR